jgi:predicted nucleic acid-binding Zn ribbon protein
VPARRRRGDPDAVAAARRRWASGAAERVDLRLLVKDTLALLAQRAPGGSVEVRVPPYGVVQVVGGTAHKRGTPPAVVETSPQTWLELAYGVVSWADAVGAGEVAASGERSDLSAWLPLT